MASAALMATLPPMQRLALSYAPRSSRLALLGFLALDKRLSDIVRNSREPMLAQMRLTWWREHLSQGPEQQPRGEPLFTALAQWPGPIAALIGLVDGWEEIIGAPPLPLAAFQSLAAARAACFANFATSSTQPAALRMGQNWGTADIAAHLSEAREREAVLALVRAQDWRWQRLPRQLRPLAVLHGLAARTDWRNNESVSLTPGALLAAIRIGITGR
ncbi:MAG: squalene/phytoene synthase family protein [Novosphingobium sp.]